MRRWNRIALLTATACFPWAAQAGKDAVPYPQSAPPRVAYIQKVTPGFELRILDVATGENHDLLHFIYQPGNLSVARHGQVLLVFGDDALHVVDTGGKGQQEIPGLPEPILAKGFSNPAPETAGYLQDGSLALVMRADDRTSDMMFYLYRRSGDGWKALETSEACGYYRECAANYGFKHPLDARELDGVGPEPIMGKDVEKDPFFVSRSTRADPERDEDSDRYAIEFDFGASRSTLLYETAQDPDDDGKYITSLTLELPGQKPQVLCEGQCGGEIMGRYLLGAQLIDLSNGKSLLYDGSDPLQAIGSEGWVY